MQPMQPTTNKETIEAELKAQKEKRPYFVTKLQGVIARDRFPPVFGEEIWSVHYPEGYIYKVPKKL